MNKKRIAVIGSASAALPKQQQMLAFDIGRMVIDAGCRLVNGGMGGVMEHSARGARSSASYQTGDTIGILPSYNANDANPYIDIPLATGLGVARNAVLMASCDAVIAVDGGSGTLSEVALAWQMKKPIACVGDDGWHKRLLTLALDARREDAIEVLELEGVADFITKLGDEGEKFNGVAKSSWSLADIASYIVEHLPDVNLDANLCLLGKGSEGVVVKDSSYVYKVFAPSDYKMLLYSNLSALSDALTNSRCFTLPLPCFEVFKGERLVIRYPYFSSKPYIKGEKQLFIAFLKQLRGLGWCLSNVKAENFRIADTGELILIDIGRDIMPFTSPLFYSTCKRAFLTIKFSGHAKIKQFYRYTNNHDDFDLIALDADVDMSSDDLQKEFACFYEAVISEV